MTNFLKFPKGFSFLGRLQSTNPSLWPKDVNPNLIRYFSALSSSNSNDSICQFAMVTSCPVPHRLFHKQLTEIRKRITWRRPKKIPCTDPEKSGDLSGLPKLDMTLPPTPYLESLEYQTAPDLVKRVVSLEYQPKLIRRNFQREALVAKVNPHKYSDKNIESQIAKLTASIRRIQSHLTHHPHDGKARADGKEIIDLRKKKLKVLRTKDYKLFEWLLEELDLIFKPLPPKYARVERKASMRRLVSEYAANRERNLLNEYRKTLESKKADFYKRKLASMQSIVADELNYGLQPSFTEEEIKELQDTIHVLDKEMEEKLRLEEVSRQEDF